MLRCLVLLAGCSSLPEMPAEHPRPAEHSWGGDTGESEPPAASGGEQDAARLPADTGGGTAEETADPWGDELDCSPGPGDGLDCTDEPSSFLRTVQAAVSTVVAAHPDWFGLSEEGWTTAVAVEPYMDAVVDEVNRHDLCAIRDPNAGDEIAVKFNNAYAESFDILTWDLLVRTGDGIYNGRCVPAWF